MTKLRRVIGLLMVLFQIGGCGSQAAQSSGASAAKTTYTAPQISEAVFHRDQAQGANGVLFDLSSLEEGYVAVSAKASSRLKFQVIKGETTYTYDLPNDGTETIYGLQSGDGEYQFRVLENVVDTKYAELYSASAQVKLLDEFQPFLRTNQYAAYTKDSACVKKAAELSAGAASQLEVVQAVFSYICDTVTYDREKAKTVESGYIPVPDETMEEGKGICFDYASLAASMLRSQGVPTKIIFGYVAPDELYHAWNMFYTKETGWITVEYRVTGKKWTRIDCTFSANGADPETIGDGSNYTDVYVY